MKNLLNQVNFIDIKFNSVSLFGDKNNGFTLFVNNNQVMTYNFNNQNSTKQQMVFKDYGYGHCILSGLGMGFAIDLLLDKPEIETITVYEINEDVIKLNEMLGLKHPKLKLINKDINTVTNTTCDCLFLDHYEDEPDHYILNNVKNINFNIKSKLFWFWKAEKLILDYINFTKKENIKAYEQFLKDNNITNMPKFAEFHINKYVENWKNTQ